MIVVPYVHFARRGIIQSVRSLRLHGPTGDRQQRHERDQSKGRRHFYPHTTFSTELQNIRLSISSLTWQSHGSKAHLQDTTPQLSDRKLRILKTRLEQTEESDFHR